MSQLDEANAHIEYLSSRIEDLENIIRIGTARNTELVSLLDKTEKELVQYKSGFKNEQHKFGVEFLKNEKLQKALVVAVEALEFYSDEFEYAARVQFYDTTGPAEPNDEWRNISIGICSDKGKTSKDALTKIKELKK